MYLYISSALFIMCSLLDNLFMSSICIEGLLIYKVNTFLIIIIMYIDSDVSPKAAAEELGYTFLPCVLSYLHRAPKLVLLEDKKRENLDNNNRVGVGAKVSSTSSDVRSEIKNKYLKSVSDNYLSRFYISADDVDAVVVPVSLFI